MIDAVGAVALAGEGASPEEVRAVYSAANERFHTGVHRAAASRLFTDVIALCSRVLLTLTRHIIDFHSERICERAEEHHQIFNAILARQPREAERLMYEHDQAVRRALIRMLAKSSS